MSVPEGWYADPQDPTPGAERWWNGHSWTAHTRRQPPPPAPALPPPPSFPPPATRPSQQPPSVLPDGTPLAELGPRIGAHVIDVVVVWLVASIVSGIIGVGVAVVGVLDVLRQEGFLVGPPTHAVVVGGLWVLYQVVTLARGGRSLGKRLLGIRVRPLVAEGPIDAGAALRRALAGAGGVLLVLFPGSQLLCFALLGYDAYRMQDDPLRRPWHDQVVGTVVVKDPSPGR